MSMKLLVGVMIPLLISSLAFSEEPASRPILRIEPGMHTAAINSFDLDSENHYLVTGSDDNTVRVWDMATGKLLRTLRPPLGQGKKGMIYAVAISPNGTEIACGGWTGYDKGGDAVYIFQRDTGAMQRRISGLPNVVQSLAYSKDGQFLVATLGGRSGIRVFSTTSPSITWEDTEYAESTYGADFDGLGRLVVASDDGFIRLYPPVSKNRTLKTILDEQAPGGKKPRSIRFSPDGTKIALGYRDTVKVDVLSAATLRLLYSADTTQVDDSVHAVSWSADGQFLFAGGLYSDEKFYIRKWTDSGAGSYVDIPTSYNTLKQLRAMNNGGVAFVAMDPAFGWLNAHDKLTFYQGPLTSDLRKNYKELYVSNDGKTVRFSFGLGKRNASFALSRRILEVDSFLNHDLVPPRDQADGLAITNWQSQFNPKLNGRNLSLENEMARAVAIAPDNETFLLGSEWHLSLFDRDGLLKWQIPVPGIAWGVNVSGDGRLAVAALGDGTIRWYRMTNGEELVSLFPATDEKRFVLWTPSGFYDASPGGEEFIGWHINKAPEAESDFFPVSKFRNTYYRPDIVKKVFELLDEQEAIGVANKQAGREMPGVALEKRTPPVLSLVSPLERAVLSDTSLAIKFTIRMTAGQQIKTLLVQVDNKPWSYTAGSSLNGGEIREVRIEVPKRDSMISILAENEFGWSEPATVHLTWRGPGDITPKPKLYILAIGISAYPETALALLFPAKDAQDFVTVMRRQEGGLYRKVEVKLLTNENATRDEILLGLQWIRNNTTRDDFAMVFLAGHGKNDDHGDFYFLPIDVDRGDLIKTGLPHTEILRFVRTIYGTRLFFLDVCRSGNVLGGGQETVDVHGFVNGLTDVENGAVVFASSSGNQDSLENPTWGNGAFTKALVEGLAGEAQRDGEITVALLEDYITRKVTKLTGGKQVPIRRNPSAVPNFAVAVKLE